MINIITDSARIVDKNIIMDAYATMDLNISAKDFGELDMYAIHEIDNAKILDKSIGTVQTPFGVTDILKLSMGCKVVLVYLYMRRNINKYTDYVLNVTECGANALEVLFECASRLGDSSITFLLEHSDGIELCSERDFVINGNRCEDLAKGVALYG